YVGFLGYNQLLPYLVNTHAVFQAPIVKIGNATGYLVDQAGKTDSPADATLDFGRPFTFQLDMVFPTNSQGSTMTVAISSVAATLVETMNGRRLVPEQVVVEDPLEQFARLVGTGLMSFASGILVSIGLTRPPGADKVVKMNTGAEEHGQSDSAGPPTEAHAKRGEVKEDRPPPHVPEGPGLAVHDRFLAVLQEANEATRFEGEALWHVVEFFVGISGTLLVAAFAVFQIGADPSLKAPTASGLALLGGMLGVLGLLVLAEESIDFLRVRLVRDRLLRAAGGATDPVQLDYEARMLTVSESGYPSLRPEDLRAIAQGLRSRGGVRSALRTSLAIMAVGAILSVNLFVSLERFALDQFLEWEALCLVLGLLAVWGLRGFHLPVALEKAAAQTRGRK
ncbi:MAG TPA: hypothetical protein VEY12_01540, partial [Thermoplasmata archaeon]|nr:hypothetical protein [Thermoplasmata archaeon]